MCWLFSSTIEVVLFCLRGWCMLDMFLLPAFIHLQHECQDLLSLSSKRVFFENGVRTLINSKGKVPSTVGSEEGQTAMLHHAGQRVQYTTD